MYKLVFVIKENSFLFEFFYKPYKRFIKKQTFETPTSKTDLCIESYPSSANTFFYNVIKYLKSNWKIAHHTHSLQSLKLAKKYDIATIVIIRNPNDAISSRVARFGSSIDLSIYEYYKFYSYVLNSKKFFRIVFFDDIVNDFEGTIKSLSSYLDVDISKYNLTSIKKETFDHIKDYNKNREQIAIPTTDREKKKADVQKKMRLKSAFSRVDKLYQEFLTLHRER